MFSNVFENKTVWISGHTGFKGAWLTQWLIDLGAKVHGYSLPPPTNPALFDQLGLKNFIHHEEGDVRDIAHVRNSIEKAQPDFVFHLAAQPLVRASYSGPVETYSTNVMGTVNVLEGLKTVRKACSALFITSDKCYDNREQQRPFLESDALGGHDPYSSSKAAAEIAIQSYRRSFFSSSPVKIASVRAGNVIGGGDWAQDRIVPDCIRALQANQPIAVRNKNAVRPWQHVLEPLSGYLWLAARLQTGPSEALCSAFNFGPAEEATRSVGDLVEEILKHWPGTWVDQSDPNAVHEAKVLRLNIQKAHSLLEWEPVWSFPETIRHTVEWYRAASNSIPEKIVEMTRQQLRGYTEQARSKGLLWAAQTEP